MKLRCERGDRSRVGMLERSLECSVYFTLPMRVTWRLPPWP
ncbi:hypothetical protein [Leptolyngbya sp. CCY15150]|nr:hypothetical protein [Leptolyngbya sp. CCY15150]